MPRRTVLFSPGDRPRMLRKAPETGADVVVFDLEDAVAPGRKAAAREHVSEVLGDPCFEPAAEVWVRVNPLETTASADVEALAGVADRLDAVMLPKAEAADDVEALAGTLAAHDATVPVVALVESARGVLNAAGIADATATDALAFGAEDYAVDVGANRTEEGTEVLYARTHVVAAAAAAGVDAIDAITVDFEDVDRVRADARRAADHGFDGKLCIHPAQVEPIHGAFAPGEADLRWARRVLAAREEADAAGRGVFRVDGEMIDAPLVRRAERLVDRASDAEE